MPPPVVTAEAATTISLPKTAFATISPTDMQVHTKTRETEVTNTATVVTRRSIATIVWTPDNDKSRELSRKSSKSKSSQGQASVPISPGNGQDRASIPYTGFSTRNSTTLEDLVNVLAEVSTARSSLQSKSSTGRLTSFPGLRSRHCTNEWLNPPTRIENIVEPPTDDLYHQGVDAHCGVPRPSIVYLEEPQKPPQCDYGLFSHDPFFLEKPNDILRRATEASVTPLVEKRWGHSIGAASHCRRSSQLVPSTRKGSLTPNDSFIPNLIQKIRTSGN